MKIYNKDIIHSLQNAIDKVQIKMETFKDYTFIMPFIQIAEIKLQLTEKDGKRDVMYIITNTDINGEYLKEWKKTAPGKFIINDFKNDSRDFIGNTLYHEITFTNEKHISYKVIVRLLNEITDTTLAEEDKNELIKLYGDIHIDNKYFSVIKVYINDERYNIESKDSYKLLDSPKITSSEIEKTTSIIEDIQQEETDEESEENLNLDPLF
jgi:hypothetical protein